MIPAGGYSLNTSAASGGDTSARQDQQLSFGSRWTVNTGGSRASSAAGSSWMLPALAAVAAVAVILLVRK